MDCNADIQYKCTSILYLKEGEAINTFCSNNTDTSTVLN